MPRAPELPPFRSGLSFSDVQEHRNIGGSRRPNRRDLLAGATAVAGLGFTPDVQARNASANSFAGEILAADVLTYDRFGDHRTGSDPDLQTTHWLSNRLEKSGFQVELQPFETPLFSPDRCTLTVGTRVLSALPAWPVHPTSAAGIRGPLLSSDTDGALNGIHVIRLPFGRGGAWGARGLTDSVMQAFKAGAQAVVAVTEGPTGEVIGLNANPEPFRWPGPVVIVGGHEGDFLAAEVSGRSVASLVSTGSFDPQGKAFNVLGRRPGKGKAIAVSTPASGWFHCAGERGSGIAIFLSLASWLTRVTSRPLFFAANSGHELSNLGGRRLLSTLAPPPADVQTWVHIGANAAVRQIAVADVIIATDAPGLPRSLRVTPELEDSARAAFKGQAGYEAPVLISGHEGLGETAIYFDAGYKSLAALVGENPLFHTSLDRAPLVVSPLELERVTRGLKTLIFSQIG